MSEETEQTQQAILLVDDEPNILSALRRSLRSLGVRILAAGSAAAGLEVLEQEPIDLVISDMRMPQMSGAEFLAQVAARWPAAVRILLTGYADMESTIKAVNEGRIYHYLSKPWDDHELSLLVRNALERKALHDERARLTLLLEEKNTRLSELNHNLEEMVRQRTASLRQTLGQLDTANQQLKEQFFQTMKVLSRIIELRPGIQVGLNRIVGDQVKRVAIELGLPSREIHDAVFAGLLFQLGRLTLPERLNERPFYLLNPKEREYVLTHAMEGEALLKEIESLSDVAAIIRSQYEKYDGSGVPDGLAGRQIPIGARIIAVVRDYNLYMEGALTGQKKNVAETQRLLVRGRESYYDPQVVDLFLDAVVGRLRKSPYWVVVSVLPCQLREGMEVEDVTYKDKIYLKGGTLDKAYIDEILRLRDEVGMHLHIRVKVRIC